MVPGAADLIRRRMQVTGCDVARRVRQKGGAVKRIVVVGLVMLALGVGIAAAQDQPPVQAEPAKREVNPDVPFGGLRFDFGLMKPAGSEKACGKLGLAFPLGPRVTAKAKYQGWTIGAGDGPSFASWEVGFSLYLSTKGGKSWKDANKTRTPESGDHKWE